MSKLELRRRAWEFARQWNGHAMPGNGELGENPAANHNQCVNVANTWWERNGLTSIFGNASDWVGFGGAGRRWVTYNQRNRPRVGDVAVFIVGPGDEDGHVDLVLDGSRHPYLGLDQNFPLGTVCHLVVHDVAALAGGIRIG